jgi:protein TonB
MKSLMTFVILNCMSLLSLAQNKQFFDNDGKKTANPQYAVCYKLITIDTTSTGITKNEKTFNVDDKIQSERNYLEIVTENNKRKMVLNGLSRNWDQSGYLKSEMEYADNKLHGKLMTYWPDGKIKRKDIYESGKLLTGNCYDSIGKEVKYFPYEQMPQFPGGEQFLFKFLTYNVRYPVAAQEARIQGRVIVQFYVNVDGKIEDLKVVRSINPDLDREAIRVVNNMPDWFPGKVDGVPVRVKYTLPVNFKLQ